jgi:putative hydrolase of the HAD superfamily
VADATRILIFDADGVLIEPWGFANQLRDSYRISPDETKAFFTGPFQGCLLGTNELADVLPPFLEKWGWAGSVREFVDLWMCADDRPSERALAALSEIRTKNDFVCLASNQERHRANYIDKQMGFGKVLDKLYFSCHIGAAKPMPEFYLSIQKDLDASATEIHFWDDSMDHVDAAREIGWNAYLYTGPDSIIRAA